MKTTRASAIVDILVKAIRDEPFFSEEILKPKFLSIINGFRLNLSTDNYNNIETPNKIDKMTRALELNTFEKQFWKQELEARVSESVMIEYYKKLDKLQGISREI